MPPGSSRPGTLFQSKAVLTSYTRTFQASLAAEEDTEVGEWEGQRGMVGSGAPCSWVEVGKSYQDSCCIVWGVTSPEDRRSPLSRQPPIPSYPQIPAKYLVKEVPQCESSRIAMREWVAWGGGHLFMTGQPVELRELSSTYPPQEEDQTSRCVYPSRSCWKKSMIIVLIGINNRGDFNSELRAGPALPITRSWVV